MRNLILAAVCSLLFSFGLPAQKLVGMGDSVAAGHQSGEVTAPSQRTSYVKLIAGQMGDPLPLPLIRGGLFTTALSVTGRSRIDPTVASRQISVSGAEIATLLTDVRDLTLDSEFDLIFAPRFGNMIDVAEQSDADLIVCWLGGNDVLGALVSFDQLDASQLTAVETFETVFTELASRLGALDAHVVYGNIPGIERIAFAMDNDELTAFTGTDYQLPPGNLTTLLTAMLLDFGLADATILQDPDFVLDPTEVALIQARTEAFNQIIAEQAAANGAVVTDLAALFADLDENGFQRAGVSVTTDYLGGGFSLDAVHPSNLGHAILADAFIETANNAYGLGIPPLSDFQYALIGFFDPYIDKDGDGRVTGRLFNGLLETLAPIIGFSGDLNDLAPDNAPLREDKEVGELFLREYRKATGERKQAGLSRQEEAVRAMVEIFRTRR